MFVKLNKINFDSAVFCLFPLVRYDYRISNSEYKYSESFYAVFFIFHYNLQINVSIDAKIIGWLYRNYHKLVKWEKYIIFITPFVYFYNATRNQRKKITPNCMVVTYRISFLFTACVESIDLELSKRYIFSLLRMLNFLFGWKQIFI